MLYKYGVHIYKVWGVEGGVLNGGVLGKQSSAEAYKFSARFYIS